MKKLQNTDRGEAASSSPTETALSESPEQKIATAGREALLSTNRPSSLMHNYGTNYVDGLGTEPEHRNHECCCSASTSDDVKQTFMNEATACSRIREKIYNEFDSPRLIFPFDGPTC